MALEHRKGADLFNKLKTQKLDISNGFVSNRPGVTIHGMLMGTRDTANSDGSKTVRVQIWIDSKFCAEETSMEAGEFVSENEVRVKCQHRYPLNAGHKEEYKKQGIKLSGNAKWTLPEMNGETMTLKSGQTLDIGLYQGNGLQGNVKPGDSVTLRGLYYDVQHSEKGINDSWGVSRIEKSLVSGVANIHFSSLMGHAYNRLIKMQIELSRSHLIDPRFANMAQNAQLKDWVKRELTMYRMSETARAAANSVYIFPLQDCLSSSAAGEKMGRYFSVLDWTIDKREEKLEGDADKDAKFTVIGITRMHALQVNETEDKPCVVAFSTLIWPDTMGAFGIFNYEHKKFLEALVRVANGAVFSTPDVLAESEIAEEEIDFQINCRGVRVQTDLPRAILRQGMEIPADIARALAEEVPKKTREFLDTKHAANPGEVRKVINLCETKDAPQSGYHFFLVSNETIEMQNLKTNEWVLPPARAFIEKLSTEEKASFFPFWHGTADECEVRSEFKAQASFVRFVRNAPYIVFAVLSAEIARVQSTPNFPSFEEAQKTYEHFAHSEKLRLESERELERIEQERQEAAEAAALEAAENAHKRRVEGEDSEAKRAKVSSQSEKQSEDEE